MVCGGGGGGGAILLLNSLGKDPHQTTKPKEGLLVVKFRVDTHREEDRRKNEKNGINII